ncbi:CDP-alcohol phosphatidyltransferase family protein [Streptomyces sp. NPDC046862]|uniref:CDP-alcohol phosphatidyltransferase family protein n=1 Tax=Streptomyces sp. NPDC046862 TaxID=3154603 RepID=UPI003453E8E0
MALNNTYDARPLFQETAVGAGAQLLLLSFLGAAIGMGPAGWLTGLAFALATWAVLNRALRRTRPRSFGPANRVTLGRAILVGGVTALVADSFQSSPPVSLFVGLTAVALILDGVDGKVARRTGTSTPLGARFDMEVDAFLILVLSVYVSMALGPWVLLIGLMRYGFVAAARVMPWLNGSLPHSMARKTVAAVQGVVLLAAASGWLPYEATFALVAVALGSLLWSFGRDIAWLLRTREERTGSRAVLVIPSTTNAAADSMVAPAVSETASEVGVDVAAVSTPVPVRLEAELAVR